MTTDDPRRPKKHYRIQATPTPAPAPGSLAIPVRGEFAVAYLHEHVVSAAEAEALYQDPEADPPFATRPATPEQRATNERVFHKNEARLRELDARIDAAIARVNERFIDTLVRQGLPQQQEMAVLMGRLRHHPEYAAIDDDTADLFECCAFRTVMLTHQPGLRRLADPALTAVCERHPEL